MTSRYELTVYAVNLSPDMTGPVAMAQAQVPMDTESGTGYEWCNFHVLSGSASDWHRVAIGHFEALPEKGWTRCVLSYQYNGTWFVIRYKPLTFYTGEPTDWATGLVSGHVPVADTAPGEPYEQGPVFTIGIRRCA